MHKCKRLFKIYSTLKSIEPESKKFTNSEIRYWLINVMGYSWRKANVIYPRSLRQGLEEDRNIFKEFIKKLKDLKFLLVFIDEWSFNPSSLPLYSWMIKGQPADKVIRETTNRYNSIAALWNKNVYFILKRETSTDESICNFIKLLIKQLKITVNKDQLKNRTVFL